MLKTIIKTFERKKYPFGTFQVMMDGCRNIGLWMVTISESRRRWECGNGKGGEWVREGELKPGTEGQEPGTGSRGDVSARYSRSVWQYTAERILWNEIRWHRRSRRYSCPMSQ